MKFRPQVNRILTILDLPKDQYILTGETALLIYGIRRCTPTIEMFCTKECKKLVEEYISLTGTTLKSMGLIEVDDLHQDFETTKEGFNVITYKDVVAMYADDVQKTSVINGWKTIHDFMDIDDYHLTPDVALELKHKYKKIFNLRNETRSRKCPIEKKRKAEMEISKLQKDIHDLKESIRIV